MSTPAAFGRHAWVIRRLLVVVNGAGLRSPDFRSPTKIVAQIDQGYRVVHFLGILDWEGDLLLRHLKYTFKSHSGVGILDYPCGLALEA